tara:strand:- start:1369 stop:1797 length:429 start_codon:yes stop_codon:yes gene_type:complete
MRRSLLSLTVASGLALGACGSTGDRDFGYAAKETLGAPVSFLTGAARQAEKNPAQAIYDLTGRAVSEAGRVINGVAHMATGHKYEAEFGSVKIHPMADNDVVKAAGWGAVFAPVIPFLSYVESTLLFGTIGAGSEFLKRRSE